MTTSPILVTTDRALTAEECVALATSPTAIAIICDAIDWDIRIGGLSSRRCAVTCLASVMRRIIGVLAFVVVVVWIVACEGILDVLAAALRGAL